MSSKLVKKLLLQATTPLVSSNEDVDVIAIGGREGRSQQQTHMTK